MPSVPDTTIAATDAVDQQVTQLEAAFRLPAVEPQCPIDAAPATRRAATVAFAARAGFTPLELTVLVLFVLLGIGLGALLVLAAAA